jgi:alanyl-tRNA synthetase
MGLERIVAIKEGVFSNYDSSIFKPILDEIVKITKKSIS